MWIIVSRECCSNWCFSLQWSAEVYKIFCIFTMCLTVTFWGYKRITHSWLSFTIIIVSLYFSESAIFGQTQKCRNRTLVVVLNFLSRGCKCSINFFVLEFFWLNKKLIKSTNHWEAIYINYCFHGMMEIFLFQLLSLKFSNLGWKDVILHFFVNIGH